MIGYTMVGTKNLKNATAFYDKLFIKMGFERVYEDDQVTSWGDREDETAPRFFVCYPFDGCEAVPANGGMTAFLQKTASEVKELYDIAIESGATDEGQPGFRPERYGNKFYVAYVKDLDNNKLAFCCYDGKSNP